MAQEQLPKTVAAWHWLKEISTLHNVYFVKYDNTVSFMTVSDAIRRRGEYRGIITEEGVDTVTYFGEITDLEFENH